MHLVLTGADLAHLRDLRSTSMERQPDGTRAPTRDIPILCRDQVHYVGDAVAFIVAESRALAQDAADLIEIDYDGRDAAANTATALDPDAPLVWPELGTNRAFTYRHGDRAKAEAAFAKASKVTRIEFRNNRLVANYIEPRSAIAEWKPDEDRFVLTTGSQGVHSVQKILAGVFKIKKKQLRVVTPDVGGGFGTKIFVYREYALVMEAAKRLGRPVKWTSDRTEHFLTDAQGRDNFAVGADGDGRERPVPGAQGRPHRQYGRLHLAVWSGDPVHRHDHVDRRLRHPGARCRSRRRLHQHLSGRRLSRRRPAGGGLPGREAGRRLRAGHGAWA